MKKACAFGKVVVGAAVVALTTSCASIVNSGTQTVSVSSMPDDAKVSVLDGSGMIVARGMTPVTLTLKRGSGYFAKATYTIKIEKDGYATQHVPVVGKVSGWYVGGNLLFGGLVGWLIVDPITGGMWTLSPEEVKAELSEKHGAVWSGNSGFTVVLKEQVPQDLLGHMKPVALN
ncbi:MAG: hypothetical protein PHW08_15610 [Kiritimatiellae bacterium]|nr:hypothetical protein [Kiritimatiellia bacterium]